MSVNLSPLGGAGAQFFSNNGVPLAGGLLYTYLAGTSTPAATYTSSSGITALANPIVLDSAGRVPTGEIWLTDGISYKFVLNSATDTLIATWDNINGINSNYVAYTAQQETATATAGQTVFTTTLSYIPATNNLAVYVNGSKQIVTTNYAETNSNTVTFLTGLNVGDLVQFSTATPISSSAVTANNVGYTPAGSGAVATNVQTKLREIVSVKDYGATGDGTTDDTAAIQTALTVNAGNKIYFPTGTYKVTNTLTISTGTSIEFNGNNAVINYTGSNACLQGASVKYISLIRPNINLTSANSSAIGIQFLGGWFIKIDHPIITGVTGQTGINIVSSNTGALGWGSYMIEIFQSYLNGMTYGIKTSQQTSDTVSNTHISVYDGWGNTTIYPLYFRNVNTFNVYGFTPEGCTDGINLASCSSGLIHLGEADYSGYAVNFPDNTCSGISVFLPSLAGTGTAVNTTNYTPNLYLSNSIRLNGNPSGSVNNYYYTMSSVYSYGQSMLETVNGGGFDRNLRTYDDVKLQRLYNVTSISSGGVVGTNLRGTATFAAATTKAVAFGTAEPDASYYVALSGNAAGYCWVTSKATTGFTINCSASNSNTVDWILIR